MLGGLARWLRFGGIDAYFDRTALVAEIVARARAEQRWFLTRSPGTAAMLGPRVLVLRNMGVADEIRELQQRLGVVADETLWFSRCSLCNWLLEAVPRDTVVAMVPPYVVGHVKAFRRCRGCGRIYWSGSHSDRIRRRLAELFASA
jgi:uncharacterized protein with PIN domain